MARRVTQETDHHGNTKSGVCAAQRESNNTRIGTQTTALLKERRSSSSGSSYKEKCRMLGPSSKMEGRPFLILSGSWILIAAFGCAQTFNPPRDRFAGLVGLPHRRVKSL
eukprot:1869991-Rhodomonas_salina.1